MNPAAPVRSPQPDSTELELPVIGSGRLLPIWRLILYLVLISPILALFYLAHTGSSSTPNDPRLSAVHYIASSSIAGMETITFVWLVFAAFIMSRIERLPIGLYGLDAAPHRPRQFATGLLTGLLSLSLLVAVLWRLNLLSFNGLLLNGTAIAQQALIWLGCFLLVALFEDYLLRGYLQFILTRLLDSALESISAFYTLRWRPQTTAAIAFWSAAILLSFLFGASHGSNPGESPIGLIAASLAGLVFCLALWRTGSLWWAVGFHCAWDWSQSFLYGVGDSGGFIQGRLFDTSPLGPPLLSGGATGPEGSLLVLPVLALVAVVIVLTLPRQTTPAPQHLNSSQTA